ncbi:MAG: hypothetical protein ABJ275_07435 [Maricaulaceae bacterium]
MDIAFNIGRLNKRLREDIIISKYRAQQTSEIIDEGLILWTDKQAKNFAVAIDEPLRNGFEPIRTALQSMQLSLETIETQVISAEEEARRIFSSYQNIHNDCLIVSQSLDQARYYTADARDQASLSMHRVKSITSRLQVLAMPPV